VVQLLGLDNFELAKELLRNRLKIVWVMKLRQAQDDTEVGTGSNTAPHPKLFELEVLQAGVQAVDRLSFSYKPQPPASCLLFASAHDATPPAAFPAHLVMLLPLLGTAVGRLLQLKRR